MEHDQTGHSAETGKQERKEQEDLFGHLHSEREEEYRSGPSWRGLLIAVIAAVILSVGATLLLGGSFGFGRQGTSAGCGAGAAGDCCAPPEGR